jgi:DNA topoisomerase I
MVDFGRALPRIRRQVAADLARPGLPREKILATVVRLLEASLIRVGNEEYARHNGSYGLTTLRTRHVRVKGSRLRFEFRGKGGKLHSVDVSDARLARIVQRCQDLPGHELFQYVDDDRQRQTIDSADVNAYVRAIAGAEFTAKDFRTWAGTVLAATTLRTMVADGATPDKKQIAATVATVAQKLGNTPAICRKSYIHPAILNGSVGAEPNVSRSPRLSSASSLRPEERAVLRFLEKGHHPNALLASRRRPARAVSAASAAQGRGPSRRTNRGKRPGSLM